MKTSTSLESVGREYASMFLNLRDRGLPHRIDARALKVLDTWSAAPCGQPSAMNMDHEHGRVFHVLAFGE